MRIIKTGWIVELIVLSLVLSGCSTTLSGGSGNHSVISGPTELEYWSKVNESAREGQWMQAAAWADKAAERNLLSDSEKSLAIYSWRRSGDYLKLAGQLSEAQDRWLKAADMAKQLLQEGSSGSRVLWLSVIAENLDKAGQTQGAQEVWKQAALAAAQKYEQGAPSGAGDRASSLIDQAEYWYKADERQLAITVLQSALPWAQQDWKMPPKPDSILSPYQLNKAESLLGEALLSVDKAQANAVFERLWSRREHPYSVDRGGEYLWQAAQALEKEGDYAFARRMYLATVQTLLLDSIGASAEFEINYPLIDKLRKMGFEQDAVWVEERINEAKTLYASTHVKEAQVRLWASYKGPVIAKLKNEGRLVVMQAEGYEYFNNQGLADAFWRKAAVLAHEMQQQVDFTREEQGRKQAEKEEKSRLFMSFMDALSGGTQAYADARRSGAASIARTEAVLRAISQSFESGTGSSLKTEGVSPLTASAGVGQAALMSGGNTAPEFSGLQMSRLACTDVAVAAYIQSMMSQVPNGDNMCLIGRAGAKIFGDILEATSHCPDTGAWTQQKQVWREEQQTFQNLAEQYCG